MRQRSSTMRRSLSVGITNYRSGYTSRGMREPQFGLLVSPGAAEEEVQDHEPAEEEDGDDGHEPDDAEQKINSLQNLPAFRDSDVLRGPGEAPPKVGTAGFEPATTRPPAECATRLRHVPMCYRDHTRRTTCYHRRRGASCDLYQDRPGGRASFRPGAARDPRSLRHEGRARDRCPLRGP